MFSKTTLLLYQQDLQLGPYIFMKWQLATDQGGPNFPLNILQNNYSAQIPRVV